MENTKKKYSWFYVVFLFLMLGLYIVFSYALAYVNGEDKVIYSSLWSDGFFGVFCLLEYWYFVLRWRESEEEPFPERVKWNAPGILVVALLFFVLWFVTQMLGFLLGQLIADPNFVMYNEFRAGEVKYFMLLTMLVAPFSEECLFRGTGYAMMRKKVPVLVAAALSSLLFAASHMTWHHLFSAFFVGLFSCWLYELTGRLYVCIVFHILYNLASLSILLPAGFLEDGKYALVFFVEFLIVASLLMLFLFAKIDTFRTFFFVTKEQEEEKKRRALGLITGETLRTSLIPPFSLSDGDSLKSDDSLDSDTVVSSSLDDTVKDVVSDDLSEAIEDE